MILGPNTLKFEENYCGKILFTNQYLIEYRCDSFQCRISHGKNGQSLNQLNVPLEEGESTIVKLIQQNATPFGATVVSIKSVKLKTNEYRSMMEQFLGEK